ncbi:uncharacterized protein [Coffea arabica]|uniref:Extra-large guanine nucleotide-binding protein 3-like n=1 Tax=Coffea arabica TaxID=13443 RepID=A0ABM4VDH9_COFAR
MGDLTKLAKAKRELEELYSGIPDDSVNLTFQDLAEVRQQNGLPSIDKNNAPPTLDSIIEASPRKEEVAPLKKIPSLDFSRGLEASASCDHQIHYQSHHLPHIHHLSKSRDTYNSPMTTNHLHQSGVGDHQGANGHRSHHYVHGQTTPPPHHYHHARPYSHSTHGMHNNMGYGDMSQMSGISMASMSGYPEIGGRRRPGIPHSNICTVCTTYIYVFRHRCLVCGRVYCRQCVVIGMGEMTEGRKCIECLGRRFGHRYIERAGQMGCCMGYPSLVKQQELKWAEKGPRGSGENRYSRSGMVSTPRSPAPRTPNRGRNNHHAGSNNNNPASFVGNAQSSFVMGSPYSPYYSPTNHPLPF